MLEVVVEDEEGDVEEVGWGWEDSWELAISIPSNLLIVSWDIVDCWEVTLFVYKYMKIKSEKSQKLVENISRRDVFAT